VGAVGAV
jgi:hypothetical protein